jgi:30S ribosomal protein S31
MGRGDIKSKKGKISNGSYGVRRKRKQAKKYVAGGEVKAKPATTLFPDEEVKKAAKKAAPKKSSSKS